MIKTINNEFSEKILKVVSCLKFQLEYSKKEEFWKNVAKTTDIPIAGKRNDPKFTTLSELFRLLKTEGNEIKQKEIVKKYLITNPETLKILRLFVGISTTKLQLDCSGIFKDTKHPEETNSSLCGCNEKFIAHTITFFINLLKNTNSKVKEKTAEVLTDYLCAEGLLESLTCFGKLKEKDRQIIVDTGMMPPDLRQSLAKRRGHGAEGRIAEVIEQLGCDLHPKNKASEPMKGDIRLEISTLNITKRKDGESKKKFEARTLSYDLVILNSKKEIEVLVVGTVHTSNPGEYGKQKIEKEIIYKKMIDDYNSKNKKNIILCALADGKGFSMSTSNLDAIIDNVDDVIQINTVYKIGLILHKKKLCNIKAIELDSEFYSIEEMKKIKKKYIPNDVKIITSDQEIDSTWKKIPAGKAILYI